MNTAARRLSEFKRLVGPFQLDVHADDSTTQLRFKSRLRPDLPWSLALTEILFLVAFVRRATRHPVHPLRLTAQALPSQLAAYTEYLGATPELGEDYTVSFSAVDARRPFLTHNDRMWESFEPNLRRRMAEADTERSTQDQVRGALFELLPSGRAKMRDVAKELGMSTRTLQRRLASEDTTWLDVLNQTRESLALHYLRRTDMSPAEVAFLLGFEDPTSLFRAFQRWTGTTPESWRAGVRA